MAYYEPSYEVYVVYVYDTDYGHKTSWEFETPEQAERWFNALLMDYGSKCQAFWQKEKRILSKERRTT